MALPIKERAMPTTRDYKAGAAAGRPTLKILLIGLLVGGFGLFRPAFAQQPGQKTFSSPAAAAAALVAATQKNDEQEMLAILGHSAKDLISSGDRVDDKERHELFVKKYHEMHRFVTSGT